MIAFGVVWVEANLDERNQGCKYPAPWLAEPVLQAAALG